MRLQVIRERSLSNETLLSDALNLDSVGNAYIQMKPPHLMKVIDVLLINLFPIVLNTLNNFLALKQQTIF